MEATVTQSIGSVAPVDVSRRRATRAMLAAAGAGSLTQALFWGTKLGAGWRVG